MKYVRLNRYVLLRSIIVFPFPFSPMYILPKEGEKKDQRELLANLPYHFFGFY